MSQKRWSMQPTMVGLGGSGGSGDFGVPRRRSGTDPTGYVVVPTDDEHDYYMWQGTGWDDEVLSDSGDEDEAMRPRRGVFRDLESKKMAHRFTPMEEARMAKFESIDYWISNNRLYRDNLEKMKKEGRGTKWIVYALIGLTVGLLSFILMNTIEFLSDKRRTILQDALKDWKSDSDKWVAFSLWAAFSVVCIAVSTGLCGLWPYAAGSGVPDVMAYLNGVMFPKVFNLRTLIGKIISCSLAVAGGLPVGPEGPMIHIGALVGAGLGTGRSRTLGKSSEFFGKYRNPRDHRDFITGGACAGVACAFSAPIGGLLFVVEEMSSFFSKKAMWMAFFSSLMAIITANTLNSKFSGYELRDDLSNRCSESLSWNAQFTILFKANVLENVNLLSVPFTLVLGIFCGLAGALFTFFNIKVVRYRMHKINKSTTTRMLEPLVIILAFVTLSFVFVYSLPCKTKPGGPFDLNYGTNGTGELKFFDAICSNPDKEYHPLGTLAFASADDCVRLLLRRGDPTDRTKGGPLEGSKIFDYDDLALWFLLYAIFACWSAGTYLACGLVVPMLIIGSTMGRIYGLAVVDLMQNLAGEDCNGVDGWVDPGVFALFGAAGFFAGVSRLTFSLCVIMLEITGDLPHLPNIMLCVMVAKTVADSFTHALYHALLELKCVPFLDFDIHLPYLDCYTARDLIKSNPTRPVCLQIKESIGHIMHCLHDTPHNAFPVVAPIPSDAEGAGIYKGTVLRSQLEQLLWFVENVESTNRDATPKLDYDTMTAIREKIFWERLDGLPFKEGLPTDISEKIIDLLPLTNTSGFCVPETFAVSATYTLFRGMGLRHLVVVNNMNSVLGIITRKDLVAHNILKHTIEGNVGSGLTSDDHKLVFGSPLHTHHYAPSGIDSLKLGPTDSYGNRRGSGNFGYNTPTTRAQSMLNISTGVRTQSPSLSDVPGTPTSPKPAGPSIQADQH